MAFIILIPAMLIILFATTFIKESGPIGKFINKIFDGILK